MPEANISLCPSRKLQARDSRQYMMQGEFLTNSLLIVSESCRLPAFPPCLDEAHGMASDFITDDLERLGPSQ